MKITPIILLAIFAVQLTAYSQSRIALVIGNERYQHAQKLRSPSEDASDMEKALRSAGFTVLGGATRGTNLSRGQMIDLADDFLDRAASAEAAVFYFSGHGMLLADESSRDRTFNYLLPIEAKLRSAKTSEIQGKTLSVQYVLDGMEEAGVKCKIVILDCCQNNGLAVGKSGGNIKGGAGAEGQFPKDSFLALASSPGTTADDGNGARNSPFTAAILRHLPERGATLSVLFAKVQDTVEALGARQSPLIQSRLSGQTVGFSFYQGGGGVPPRPKAYSKDNPLVNSLGQEFIPVPGQRGVLMCRTETRLRDFRAYVQSSGYAQSGGAYVLKVEKNEKGGHSSKWELDSSASWDAPGFTQTADHPVTCVNWTEVTAFCAWLSKKEGRTYRLPSDAEWSAACGSLTKYPWGNSWPAPKGAGNYAGAEKLDALPGTGWATAYDHNDGSWNTARVASYDVNRFGFYDLGGNVWEWTSDWYRDAMNDPDVVKDLKDRGFTDGGGRKYRVLRGGSWYNYTEIYLRSSRRVFNTPSYRGSYFGFRCVLEEGVGG